MSQIIWNDIWEEPRRCTLFSLML